jgi:hypothetical protein
MRYTPVRYTPMMCTLMRCTLGTCTPLTCTSVRCTPIVEGIEVCQKVGYWDNGESGSERRVKPQRHGVLAYCLPVVVL